VIKKQILFINLIVHFQCLGLIQILPIRLKSLNRRLLPVQLKVSLFYLFIYFFVFFFSVKFSNKDENYFFSNESTFLEKRSLAEKSVKFIEI